MPQDRVHTQRKVESAPLVSQLEVSKTTKPLQVSTVSINNGPSDLDLALSESCNDLGTN